MRFPLGLISADNSDTGVEASSFVDVGLGSGAIDIESPDSSPRDRGAVNCRGVPSSAREVNPGLAFEVRPSSACGVSSSSACEGDLVSACQTDAEPASLHDKLPWASRVDVPRQLEHL